MSPPRIGILFTLIVLFGVSALMFSEDEVTAEAQDSEVEITAHHRLLEKWAVEDGTEAMFEVTLTNTGWLQLSAITLNPIEPLLLIEPNAYPLVINDLSVGESITLNWTITTPHPQEFMVMFNELPILFDGKAISVVGDSISFPVFSLGEAQQ